MLEDFNVTIKGLFEDVKNLLFPKKLVKTITNDNQKGLISIKEDEKQLTKKEKNSAVDFFFDYLPFGSFDYESMSFENKTTFSFLLRVSPFTGIDQKSINVLTQAITNEIPTGSCVQILNFASPDIRNIVNAWEDGSVDKNNIFSHLASKRKKFYLEGYQNGLSGKKDDLVLRNFELYLSISFSKRQTTKANKEFILEISEIRKKIIRVFSNADCYVKTMDKIDADRMFYKLLFAADANYNENKSIAGVNRIPGIHERCQYQIYPDYFELTIKDCKRKYLIFEVDSWPLEWSLTNSINYVGNFTTGKGIAYPFYISYGFKVDDQHESERRAGKMRILRTNQTSSKLAAFFPSMLEEISDWQFVSEQIANGAKLAKAVMQIVVMVDSQIDEKIVESLVKDHFYQLGFSINKVRYDIMNNFIASLPMGMAENWQVFMRQKLLSTVTTNSCINLLPIFADCQNFTSPLMMFVGRRGQLFFFDNFESSENGNYNMVVVGKSGSGKSVFLQEYVSSILRIAGQVVVIDDGRSFANTCAILGGEFVDFASDNLCINPFSLYDASRAQEENFAADFEEPLIDLIVSILCIICNIDKNSTKDFDIGLYRDILRKSVQIVLEQKGASGGISDVREELLKNKIIRDAQTKDIADKIAFILREYATGRYSSYYNGQANLTVEKFLTIFELSSLEANDVLQTSVLLTVIFLVYVRMQGRIKRTSLIIDEAWKLLRHDAIRGFIEGIARRARKYNGNLVVATQSISDFSEEKSAAAASVLSQSDWRVILSAESKDEKILKEQLGMEAGEVEIARNLRGDKGRYSEFIIRHSSGSWLIGRLVLDPFSAKLYSSRAEDVIAIKKMKGQGYELEQAIEKLIEGEK